MIPAALLLQAAAAPASLCAWTAYGGQREFAGVFVDEFERPSFYERASASAQVHRATPHTALLRSDATPRDLGPWPFNHVYRVRFIGRESFMPTSKRMVGQAPCPPDTGEIRRIIVVHFNERTPLGSLELVPR